MKKGDKLFVRTDYKVQGTKVEACDFNDHIEYLKGISDERYFIGGGFLNRDGGMIVFEAKDLAEAKDISDKDPIIKRGFYSYELNEWELVIISDKIYKNN